MNLDFWKMTGSGNDFIFLDGRQTRVSDWPDERIQTVCARRHGIGADGLVILAPDPTQEPGTVGFHYFNSDGGRAEMCGNAALCAPRATLAMGLTAQSTVTLITDSGPVITQAISNSDTRSRIRLPDTSAFREPEALSLAEGEDALLYGAAGVPHVVVVVSDVDQIDFETRSMELRHNPMFEPSGTNVNFVSHQDGAWRLRTFERGVEGETLACGTGCVAAAAALAAAGLSQFPCHLVSRSGLGLEVSGTLTPDGLLTQPTLSGEGRFSLYRPPRITYQPWWCG